ncbi:MAG: ammonia-forming cytochrome c nitrite reductase [Muribaculaceae bacterium]|nr:ammonia-forming cytochrome c nitrite reductase [Muribaculaceae bacterium]
MDNKCKSWKCWAAFIGGLVAVFAIGFLTSALMERRAEVASVMNNVKTEVAKGESKNDAFEINYPREFQTWTATADTTFESEFNGSQFKDVLDMRPNMVVLWAGYAFAWDYTTPRGHMHAIYDITRSLRTGAPGVEGGMEPQPSTCWTCKSPDVPRLMQEMGLKEYYSGKWGDAKWSNEVVNPIGCSDCHDASNAMALTISRPALKEAFERMGKDIGKATHQEMRTLVCAQCHVEYYFRNNKEEDKKNYLTFPWDKGVTVENIEQYYDEYLGEDGKDGKPYYDYLHAMSKAPILKAQHPGYETWQMGIHGQRGVSCADCHMPYMSEGGVKFSDHHIQSPLAKMDRTCQTCHRETEETLRNNVYERQRKINEIRTQLEAQLAAAHIEAKACWDKGATDADMKDALQLIRKSQWRWDFAVASHGAAFHAPVEIARILSNGLAMAYEARMAISKVLNKLGIASVNIPNFKNKAEAQKFIEPSIAGKIGSFAKIEADKQKFMSEVRPKWIEAAQKNGKLTMKGLE